MEFVVTLDANINQLHQKDDVVESLSLGGPFCKGIPKSMVLHFNVVHYCLNNIFLKRLQIFSIPFQGEPIAFNNQDVNMVFLQP